MMEFLSIAFALPTAVWSVFLCVVGLYWIMVLAGALDIDTLHIGGDGISGATKGALEGLSGAAKGASEGLSGAAKGATEGLSGMAKGATEGLSGMAKGATEGLSGMAKGATEGLSGAAKGASEGLAGVAKGATEGLEGAAKGATEGLEGAAKGATEGLEGAAKGSAEAAEGSMVAAVLLKLLNILGIAKVPITVSGSFIVLFGWITSFATMAFAVPYLGGAVSEGVILGGATALSLLIGLAFGSLLSRPFGPIFTIQSARGRHDFIGQACTLTTTRVDGRFGQAEIADGGSGLVVQVRCDIENGLQKGASALVVSYDRERDAFIIEPLHPTLSTSTTDAQRNRARATAAQGNMGR